MKRTLALFAAALFVTAAHDAFAGPISDELSKSGNAPASPAPTPQAPGVPTVARFVSIGSTNLGRLYVETDNIQTSEAWVQVDYNHSPAEHPIATAVDLNLFYYDQGGVNVAYVMVVTNFACDVTLAQQVTAADYTEQGFLAGGDSVTKVWEQVVPGTALADERDVVCDAKLRARQRVITASPVELLKDARKRGPGH